jgi:Tol biopolymer transport system component
VLVALVAATVAAGTARQRRPAALVVYESFKSSSLEVVRADGSGHRRLRVWPGWASAPSLSPDGNRIAYTSQDASQKTPSIIRVSKLDGTGEYPIDPPVVEALGLDGARWSPNGRLIAFSAWGNPINDWDLWVVRANGTHPRELLNSAYAAGEDPTGIAVQQGSAWMWSPDGRSIAAQWPSGDPRGLITNIVVVNVFNGQTRVLTQGSEPAWSRDGSRIAYHSATGIDVIRVDAGGHRQLVRMQSPDPSWGVMPSWSPDGKTIAFWRNETLESIDAAGRSRPLPLLLLHGDPTPYRAEWSRDSRVLLASSYTGGVWVVPIRRGSHPRLIEKNGSRADWRG